MPSLSRWAPIALAFLELGSLDRSASAQSVDRAAPPRVRVTIVGIADTDRSIDARIGSLFPSTTRVECRRMTQIAPDAVLVPGDAENLYLWILLNPDSHARVYAAVRGADSAATRHLFRDVELEAGLDEVGGETLSHIAHSSAMALWQRKQETSKQRLEKELARDADLLRPVAQEPTQPAIQEASMVSAAKRQPAATRGPAARPPPVAQSSEGLGVGIGAALGVHASGKEGFMFEPGGFLSFERQWSLHIGGSYLVPHDFEVSPARVRTEGGAVEARAGWVISADSKLGLRLRPELGIGILFVTWRAEAEPPAVASSGETNRREYVLASLAGELPIGPIGLGIRGDLRVPFQETSYDVVYSGQSVPVATSWLSPGIVVEIRSPLTRSALEETQ